MRREGGGSWPLRTAPGRPVGPGQGKVVGREGPTPSDPPSNLEAMPHVHVDMQLTVVRAEGWGVCSPLRAPLLPPAMTSHT